MAWSFGWKALTAWMGRVSDLRKMRAIRRTLSEVPGVAGVGKIGLRRMDDSRRDDMTVVDARIAIVEPLGSEAGHYISVLARQRVLQRHRVLNALIDIDSL